MNNLISGLVSEKKIKLFFADQLCYSFSLKFLISMDSLDKTKTSDSSTQTDSQLVEDLFKRRSYILFILFLIFQAIIGIILGALGEVIPDSFKSYLTNFAEFLRLSYEQFWIISILLILAIQIIVTIRYETDGKTKRIKKYIQNSSDVSNYLNLPTLAEIPNIIRFSKTKVSSFHSEIAEAYRYLRTSILHLVSEKPPQSLLFTSSQLAEGTTTTVINTAFTFAVTGVDIVIIDCNLRNPHLHEHFAMDNDFGLSNYLWGEVGNWRSLLKPHPVFPRLKVITSGPIPLNAADLLTRDDMKDLLMELRGHFKHIFIDSPPAIFFTDAMVLSALVDGVVIVVRARKNKTKTSRNFISHLKRLGAKIYGVVLIH